MIYLGSVESIFLAVCVHSGAVACALRPIQSRGHGYYLLCVTWLLGCGPAVAATTMQAGQYAFLLIIISLLLELSCAAVGFGRLMSCREQVFGSIVCTFLAVLSACFALLAVAIRLFGG